METKQAIREEIFKRREAALVQEIKENSRIICEAVCAFPEYLSAGRILAYADFNKEVITRDLIEKAWADGKEVAVPKVHGKNMTFYLLTDFAQLKPGTFQVPEPVNGQSVDWQEGLMIVPGVAFDENRNRAGYGAGYYDKFLSAHPLLTTIAVAFDFQIVHKVPSEVTDIRPQKLITETRIFQ